MRGLPFERLFSMGAFDGLRSLRIQTLESPSLDIPDVIKLIRNIDPDAGGLDFDAAVELHTLVVADAPLENAHGFYRHCILDVVMVHRKTWARTLKLGRGKFLNQLSRDEQQCFRAAHLLDEPPSDDVVEWWDGLSGRMRFVTDKQKMAQARLAEKLSFEHEMIRIGNLGIPIKPRWVAIEDNTAGYDILSYTQAAYGPVARLIEVKSTTASPLRFYVSRNEWEQAVKYGSSYYFHIWDMTKTPPKLYERTTEQIKPHVPTDGKKGKWTNAEIPVGGI